MLNASRRWFNQIAVHDPVEREQAKVMQAILLVLLGITTIGIVISLTDPLVSLIDLVMFGILCGSLVALRRGAFRLGVRIVIGILIMAIGLSIQVISLRTGGPMLLALAVPYALAALLLGRRDLIAAVLLSNLFVLAGGIHDILDPREGGQPALPNPSMAIAQMIVFALVSVLLAYVLDRFGTSLRRALGEAAQRERELHQARASLEDIVAERTAQLVVEAEAGQRHAAELARTLEELRSSQDLVRSLSAPVIPVLPGVLVAPIIGVLDDQRAAELTNNCLQEVDQRQARVLILDVTGVSLIDTHAAGVLLSTAQAARLLGVRVFLAGIRPELAQTIVSLGLNLNLRTFATLEAAVGALVVEQGMSAGVVR